MYLQLLVNRHFSIHITTKL